LIVAPRLNERLADAKTIHPALECLSGALQGATIKRLTSNRARLQDDLESSLQVEAAANGMRRPKSADIEV
jgi:hypothetical protein